MTAVMPERLTVDRQVLNDDILEVLCRHGLIGGYQVDVSVSELTQGDAFAGVSISASAYRRPEELPAPTERPAPSLCSPEDRERVFAFMAELLAERTGETA